MTTPFISLSNSDRRSMKSPSLQCSMGHSVLSAALNVQLLKC